jgi:hypothetical protein
VRPSIIVARGIIVSGKPIDARMTAAAKGDVVVFLIGMRVNNMLTPWSWLPTFASMVRMLKELGRDAESGLLGHQLLTGSPRIYYVVQYWESKEKLLAYAADQDRAHRPAWAAFNRRARGARGRVGIWHETYLVPEGRYESLYQGMPPFGLGAAHGTEPVGRRGDRAADRLKV